MRKQLWSHAAAVALLLPFAALAQNATPATGASQGTTAPPLADAQVISLSAWNYDDLYSEGWRGSELLDAEVQGLGGDEIGDVENVIVGPDGKIRSIIAEVGGFWDIGDTHINIPWDDVEVDDGFDEVRVPVTEESVENYSMYRDNLLTAEAAGSETRVVSSDLYTGERAWKLTNLIGDYALLEDRAGYGYVDDVIFNRDGEVQAVVVSRDIGYGAPGYYAYPYYGYGWGWDPGYDYYGLPYGRDDIEGLEPFDYERMNGDAS